MGPTFIRWLAPNLLLDAIQRADTLERSGVEGIRSLSLIAVLYFPGTKV
jgi:hypothetical protein